MATRILVIEDNEMNLELMLYLLNAFSYSSLSAGDGEEGLDIALRERPDAIICDIQLPKLDGYEIARKLKVEPAMAKTPLIAVTAFAMVGDRDRILAAGFDGYIPKPIAPETFVGEVEKFLTSSDRTSRPPIMHVERTPAASQAPKAKGNILVVDDSLANAEVLKATLNPFGYEITHVVNAESALRSLHTSQPDLIICDVHMPGISGFDFFRQLKADPVLAEVPFIFISSTLRYKEPAHQTQGATKFLLRPIDPAVLLDEVRDALGTKDLPTNASKK